MLFATCQPFAKRDAVVDQQNALGCCRRSASRPFPVYVGLPMHDRYLASNFIGSRRQSLFSNLTVENVAKCRRRKASFQSTLFHNFGERRP